MTGAINDMEPGKLEDYCLGLLPDAEATAITAAVKQDPLLLQRIVEIENSLVHFSAVHTEPSLKEKIIGSLDQRKPNSGMDLSNLPLIDRNSDAGDWNELLKGIEPDKDFGALKVRFLKEDTDFELCLAWLSDELSETEHHADEFVESFLILEGSCECNIGGQVFHLKAGDYLDIPYDTPHTIRSTSTIGHVKALIQRKKIAA